MSFGHSLSRLLHPIAHPLAKAYDNNAWIRYASLLLGPSVGETATIMRQSDEKGEGPDKWNSKDWEASGTANNPLLLYNHEKQMPQNAAALNEENASIVGQGGTDATIAAIDRAYGIDTQGPQNQLQAWEKELDTRLAQPGYLLHGPERDATQSSRDQVAQLIAQVAQMSAGSPASEGKNAIDAMSGRASAASKLDATRTLDTRLAQTLTQNNANAFSRGVGGSSFDKAAAASALQAYQSGRSGIDNALASSDTGFRATLDQQRLALEDKARSGQEKSFAPNAALTDQQNAATDAYANLTSRAIGQTLATGADLSSNAAVQKSIGNQGWGGVFPSLQQQGAPPLTQSRGTSGSITR